MKFLRQGIALAVVGAGLAAIPALTSPVASSAAEGDESTIQTMREAADGSTTVRQERSTGKVGFIRAGRGGDLMPGKTGLEAKADAYLDLYADAFGAPRSQLKRDSVTTTDNGSTVNYIQEYRDVPVFGSLIRAHIDAEGDLTSVNGEAIPDLKLAVTPKINAKSAAASAVRAVKASPPGSDGQEADTTGIKAVGTELMIYRTGLVRGAEGENMLVYRVEVTNGNNVRDIVFISADYGKPVNRYSMIHDALDRTLFEADEDRNLTKVWEESDALPGTLNPDQESMVRSTGEAYWFFKNAFDRDSYDDQGSTMYTINNDPAISCPNANWNGQTTNYCDGVSSDDVVAHEWGHAYTEFTHGLIYQWQAGALNESYSDIWGETIDLINSRLDEGEGNLNTRRTVNACSTNSPAKPLLTINSPSSIAKDCLTGGASFGAQLDATGITGDVVAPTDAVDEGGTATDGCSAYNEDVIGKIVIVDRGACAFTQKAEVAKSEGAAAVIIGNNDDAAFGMSGTDESLPATVSIGLADRELIRMSLAAGDPVNITMTDAGGDRNGSFRWLVGEKSAAFGGAIRDMWNPTCYGDPGKVTDAEYKCSTDDNGGVHSNSGVPSHGYALLVDGGSYNGTEVKGIGLTKAAHIYFKAMKEYQTPVSDFVDHADSLEASCVDLTGKRLEKLSTEEDDRQPSNDKITANDCAQVTAMAKAIELRTEPVQCEFEALLPDEAGSACGEEFTKKSVYQEDFEEGFADWTQDEELAEGAVRGIAWESSYGAPDHEGGVAFGPDPLDGDCIPDSDDISSANSLISPDIEVPAGVSPAVSFDHYVATEGGWDGGLVRIKVNNGVFENVPTDAYLVNGPNLVMETEEAGNTSPLAGQEGFSGTDGGELSGSWGTSRIDLAAIGVQAGDTLQIAFVAGRDGCNGFDGWYVDNVELTVCEAAPSISATHMPEPSRYGTSHALRVNLSSTAGTPQGVVSVYNGDTRYGTRTVDAGGEASFPLPRGLHAGSHTLTVKYAGGGSFGPLAKSAKITMSRASSTTAVAVAPRTIRKPASSKVTVTVKSTTLGTPTGHFTLLQRGKSLGIYTLSGGTRTITLNSSKLVLGRNVIQARYDGARDFGISKAPSFTITVKR